MTKQLNNKRTMLESVVSLIETNAARTSSIQELAASASRLKNLVAEVQQKTVEVAEASIGKAATKMEARIALRDALSIVKAGLYAYAVKEGNTELQSKANIPNRDVRQGRDADLVASAEMILKLAQEAGSALAPHGITEEMLISFKGALVGFQAQLGEVKSGVAVRIAARMSLGELFSEADGILIDELDKYFEVLQKSDPEIAEAYFQARYIGKPGFRHVVEVSTNIIAAPVSKAA